MISNPNVTGRIPRLAVVAALCLLVASLWQPVRAQLETTASETAAGTPAATDTEPAEKFGKSGWTSYRNSFQMLGVSQAKLPDKLEELWKISTPHGTASTAAIVGDRVYIGTFNGDLFCLDRQSGQKIWTYRTIDDPDPKAFAPAFKASPTVTANAIYIGDEDGKFHAIDPKTGKKKWTFETNGEIISSASIVGEKVIFGSYDNFLYCLNAATGKQEWAYETMGYVNCSPAIAGDYTFVTGCDEHLRVINIETGKQKSEMPLRSYLIASPALKGDNLYFGTYSGEVLAVDWKKSEVVWKAKSEKGELPFHSSAAVTDKYVVVGGRDKMIHCYDRETGKPVWSTPTGRRVDSSPVIVGERVFCGSSDGHVYELALSDGSVKWKQKIGREVTASPAVGEGCLVIGSEGSDQFIYCFGKK